MSSFKKKILSAVLGLLMSSSSIAITAGNVDKYKDRFLNGCAGIIPNKSRPLELKENILYRNKNADHYGPYEASIRALYEVGAVEFISFDKKRKLDKWKTSDNFTTDGASIPEFAMDLIGIPDRFGGEFTCAAVLHDYYIIYKKIELREAFDVHWVFYKAMMAKNVEPYLAEAMYLAVALFGPSWHIISDCPASTYGNANECELAMIEELPELDIGESGSEKRKYIINKYWAFVRTLKAAREKNTGIITFDVNNSINSVERDSNGRILFTKKNMRDVIDYYRKKFAKDDINIDDLGRLDNGPYPNHTVETIPPWGKAVSDVRGGSGGSASQPNISSNSNWTGGENKERQGVSDEGEKDAGVDPGKDLGSDPGKDTDSDSGKDAGGDPGKDTDSDPGKDAGGDPGKDTDSDPGKDAGGGPGKDAGGDPGKGTGSDPGKDMTGK